MQAADAERRSRLLSLKLRAILRDHLGTDDVGSPAVFSPGAAFVSESGDEAWFLVDGDATRSIGPSLVVAERIAPGASIVNILAERDTGILARRSEYFARDIRVWHVDERMLLPAVAEPFAPARQPRPEHLSFAGLIEACGAVVVIEHGVVSGEVQGLEICRVVDDPTSGETRLEVGVGAHDREAFALVHGHMPTDNALRDVVGAVAVHRAPGAPQHPLNTFGAERLMRARAIADPATVGMVSVIAHEPPLPRTNVKDPVPCVATGVDTEGRASVLTFVHGVDLDVVTCALDARTFVNPDADVVVVSRGIDAPTPVTSVARWATSRVTFVEPK